jgi:uncharacterized protein
MCCRRNLAVGFSVLLLILLAHTGAFALNFPDLTGRVVDEAGVLDPSTEKLITDKLAAVEAKSGDQIVVATLKSLQGTSLEDFGVQLGRFWGIGQKDKNNGAILIVLPNERKVRIEVGYGLEGALTDAVTRLIIQNAILPRFKVGDFQGGITRGVDDIIQVVSGDAEDFQRRAAQRPDKSPPGIDLGTIIVIAIAFFVIMSMLRNQGSGGRRMRRGGYAGPIFIPSGGSWSSGSGGGGSSGGGGFSGGGGSFGGGGSSGDW